MDLYLKSSRESVFFSSQGCQAIAFAHDGGTTYTPLSSARSHSFSVSTASAGSPSTTVSRITAGGLPWSIRRGVVRACGQRAGAGRGTSLVRRGRSRSACVANGRLRQTGADAVRRGRGVVARIVTGPHDAHRQDTHLPVRYDTGRPRAVIRLRISQPRTTSLPCPAGLRARRPSPMMDL